MEVLPLGRSTPCIDEDHPNLQGRRRTAVTSYCNFFNSFQYIKSSTKPKKIDSIRFYLNLTLFCLICIRSRKRDFLLKLSSRSPSLHLLAAPL
jgi:hypothetical protein